jgi:hypothetical protein
MSILRRRPREVYRVYTEDEYLDGAGSEPATVEQSPVAAEPGRKLMGESRLRRAAGMAMLAGAVGAVGGVVVANSSRAHRGAGRRPGSLVAATRSSRVLRSPAPTGSRAVSSSPAVAHPSKITRPHVASSGRRRRGSNSHPPDLLRRRRSLETHPSTPLHPPMPPAGVGVQGGGGVAIVVDYSASAGSSSSPSTAAGSSSGAATAEHTEFGFEH